ncbi:Protein spinster 1 [Dirofilaria immitis]|nr:Protein spinster 1 [Dirofilaria immitis]
MNAEDSSQSLVTSIWSIEKKCASIVVLLLINLLNYMDRFTIAGVLTQIQKYFNIDDSSAGLLQTAFIVFYMVFAPVCGYYGDRYNRKFIIEIGLIIWMIAVLLSTLCGPTHFYLFLLCRGIVGIGEACYVTVAPTIIADMYRGNRRSSALMVFYFAIPVGSGLGYATGSVFSLWTKTWQWGVRLTPIFEPVRGEVEHVNPMPSSFLADIKYLFTVPTYIITTLGLTSVIFVTGCLAWWTPTLLQYAWAVHHGTSYISNEVKAEVGLIFGIITCLAGFLGVFSGSVLSQIWRSGFGNVLANTHADLHVCALGSLLAVPFLYFALVLSTQYTILCWMSFAFSDFYIFAITGCCVNSAINVDILMSVISLRRRSIATAIQTLISHLLEMLSLISDWSSIGCITCTITIVLIHMSSVIYLDKVGRHERSTLAHFIALQHSLFLPSFVLCFGSLLYLVSSFYINQDRRNSDKSMHGEQFITDDNSDTSPLMDAVENS